VAPRLKELVEPAVKPAPFLLALFVFASCGGEGSKGSVGGALPGCVSAGEPIAMPKELESVPLPNGSVIDGTRQDAAGNTIFQGYVPGDVRGAKSYFEANLPQAGYEVGEGDSEDHEADLEFGGHGIEARLKVHDVATCDGALTLELAEKGQG
jgi:hypothetical protein